MRRILSFVSSLAFTTLAFGSLQFAVAQAPSSVQVFLPNGGGPPSRSLRLTLVRDDGYVDVVFTDSNGKFKIRTPRTGTAAYYTVTVETDNQTFATTTTTFKVEPNNPNETIIFLRPLTTDKRAVIDVIDATNFEGSVPAKARAAYKHGMDFLNEGKMESAITSLQEAINLYPQYVRAMNDLGVIFLKLNRLEEAGDWFRRATEISKRFFHPRMNLGIVLNRQGKFREALEVLEPLYHENPRMLEIRLAYGRALEGAGELGTAEKLYRSTLTSKSLAPDCFMTSGTRNPPPISTSCVLEMTTRFLLANADRTSKTAEALLLTTMAAPAPVSFFKIDSA